jgi:chromosome segregation ATPase
MPTQSDRVRQLEDDARDIKSGLKTLEVQTGELVASYGDSKAVETQLATELTVQKQRIDDCVRRNEELHTRIESWETRIWGGAVALISALIAAVLSLILVIVKK